MVQALFIEPQAYVSFGEETELLEKCKEWGLLSEKAAKTKTFYYKGNGLNEACDIVGYVDKLTAVIAVGGGQLHCIHPSYLKEMQAASFGQRFAAKADAEADPDSDAAEEAGAEAAEADAEAEAAIEAEAEAPEAETPEAAGPAAQPEPEPAPEPAKPEPAKPEPKQKSAKSKKLELPEEKVKMTATVSKFTTVPNHFSDTDDEVIIYEAVTIEEPALELGEAWSSHSATLKKLELAEGDTIAFEAKVIAKKLTKHPVAYKINNPAKIQKTSG